MREFLSEEKYEISGRGTVYVVSPAFDVPFGDVMYKRVLIDGTVYGVRGIERFAKFRMKDDLLAGERIGLLVTRCVKDIPQKDSLKGCSCPGCITPKGVR